MRTVPVDAWMGHAAVVLRGVWGAVTRRAAPSGSRRTAMAQHAERVGQAVANAHAGGRRSAALWAANERRKAANEARGQVWAAGEALREGQPRARASAGSARGVSRSPLVLWVARVVPHRLVPSRATGGRGIPPSAPPSRGLLEVLERAGQGWGVGVCREEIFLPRAPLLMGVEPTSWAGWAGQRGHARRVTLLVHHPTPHHALTRATDHRHARTQHRGQPAQEVGLIVVHR